MSIKLTFEITLHADYHVSDGQRFGMSVDSALLRDHNQSPTLRGTALAGLLHDGFADLQALMNQGNVKPKQSFDNADERLFGSPAHPKAWRFGSTKLLRDGPKHQERWGSQDVWRVRINPRTRRAEPQKLFVQEKGDGRLRFTFTATCEDETERSRADAALLIAAASMVRHFGSGRRRGNGRCEFKLIEAKNFISRPSNEDQTWHDAALDAFQSYWMEGKSLPAKPAAKENTPVVPDGGQAKRFRIIARLAEPVIVAKKSQTANAFETLHAIPGTVLWGALANRASKRTRASPHTELFFRGGVSITGLLPADIRMSTLYPAVPAPQSWAQCELNPQFASETADQSHPLYDLSRHSHEKCATCGSKLEPVGGFISTASKRHYHDVLTREEIHITMDRKTGRVEEGNLFTYQMIEAGQWFIGELRCAPNMWTQLQEDTGLRAGQPYTIRLGKAARRGYGLTHLFLVEITDADPDTWTLQPLTQRVTQSGEENSRSLTMLFLTDAILTDTWGRFLQGIDAIALSTLLSIEEKYIGKVEAFVSGRSIDGFNTHRRMPRWRDEAITAGSMVRFTLNGLSNDDIAKKLQSVEKNGLGLRRQEGFGQVAFNHSVFQDNPQLDGISLAEAGVPKTLRNLADQQLSVEQAVEALQDERRFANYKWREELVEEWHNHERLWKQLDDQYEPLVRLIFLYRHRPVTDLLDWLEGSGRGALGQEENLWGGRTLVGRDKELKLDGDIVKRIKNLLEDLRNETQSHQTTGMLMLAERMGEQINKKRRENAKKEAANG